MKAMKKIHNLTDNRGSALLSVFLVIVVLMVLGMGVLSLSLANTKQAVVADTYERSYYVAEGSAKQGVERLKSAALEYYRMVYEEVKNNVQTNNNAASFFAYMDAIAYTPPQPDTSAGGPSSVAVSISHAAVDSDTHRYCVLSTATGESTSRSVSGTIEITFHKVEKINFFQPFGSKPLVVGNAIDFSQVKKGSVLEIPDGAEAAVMPSQQDLTNHVNPPTNLVSLPESRNLDWNLTFSRFDTMKSNVTSTISPKNGDTVNASAAPFNVIGENAASFSISGVTASGGFIYCSNADSASEGLKITDCHLSNVTIVCAGNVSIDGGTITNASIYCGKLLEIGPGTNTDILNSIIYATDCEMGRNGNGKSQVIGGLMYIKNNLIVNGNKNNGSGDGTITGQCVVKGNITFTDEIPNKGSFFIADTELLNNLPETLNLTGSNPFMSSISGITGGTTFTIAVPPSAEIYSDVAFAEK